jgi:cell division initiation protein
MKITPIEIRQKTFEKGFRGYEKEEVNAFLLSMSQEWEKLTDQNKEYKFKLDMTEKEVRKLKEVETSLYKTLKTAEDTGTHLIEQANKSAELRLLEAQQKADMLLMDAQNRAKAIVIEADKKAKQTLEEVLNELKSLERDFRTMENLRDNMLMELKSMANDTLERVTRMDAKHAHLSFESKIGEVRSLIDRREDQIYSEQVHLVMARDTTPPVLLPEETTKLTTTDSPVAQVPTASEPKAAEETFNQTPTVQMPLEKTRHEPVKPMAPTEEKRRSSSFFDELEAS